MVDKLYNSVKLLNKNFVLLWQGQFVSLLGVQLYMIGLILWLKNQTGSASLIGFILMAAMIPNIILGPISGVFADRYSRWKIIVYSDLIRGIIMTALAALLFFRPEGTDTIIIFLFVVAIIFSCIGTLFNPAVAASIPEIVPKEKLTAANSMYQTSTQITTILGQAVGGILFRLIGAPFLVLFNGISYIFSAISEMFIEIHQDFPEKKVDAKGIYSNFFDDVREAFRYIWDTKGLLHLLIIAAVFNFFSAPLALLFPFYIEDVLLSSADWLGYMLAISGFGSIVGYILASCFSFSSHTRTNMIIGALVIESVLFGAFGFINEKNIALLNNFLFAVFGGFAVVHVNTIIQLNTPSWIRARVFGVLVTITSGLMPLSLGVFGIILDLINHNIQIIFILSGTAWILLCILMSLSQSLREYLEYDSIKDDIPILATGKSVG